MDVAQDGEAAAETDTMGATMKTTITNASSHTVELSNGSPLWRIPPQTRAVYPQGIAGRDVTVRAVDGGNIEAVVYCRPNGEAESVNVTDACRR